MANAREDQRKIVLASMSDIKYAACKAVFPDARIVMTRPGSFVGEQPIGDETLRGARNRLGNARMIAPDGDIYVSIENGIFEESGAYVDRAVVLLCDKAGRETVVYSDGVVFPSDAVEEARRRGFQYNTAGQVMAEMGMVADAADPHLELSGRSRAEFIQDALQKARAQHYPPRPPSTKEKAPRRR